MKHIPTNRGFIQTPILIAILASLTVFSGIGYFAYEAGQRYPIHTQKSTNKTGEIETETEVTPILIEANEEEKKDIIHVQPKTVEEDSSVISTLAAPVNNNLDSTCLSFYEKMKSLDVLPIKETPIYTKTELKAIEMASQGEYSPALTYAFSKKEGVEERYQNAIRANIVQKQDLATKYAFCYEYLAKTYGFVIE